MREVTRIERSCVRQRIWRIDPIGQIFEDPQGFLNGCPGGPAVMHGACRIVGIAGLIICASFGNAAADEAGVSFWLPGQYAAFAAEPGTPGLSFEAACQGLWIIA